MKKILLILVLEVLVAKIASAQSGASGNSDWKVPIPLISPQNDQPITFNQIIVPQVTPIPATAFSSSNPLLVPQFPAVPPVPPEPLPGTLPPETKNKLLGRTPIQIMLPPLPPIPAAPVVKMPIN